MNTTTRTIIAVVVLVIILAIIFIVQSQRKEGNDNENVVTSLSVYNQSKDTDASTVSANPGDILVYNLKVENTSNDKAEGYVTEVNIADITELATLIDAQGANYNSDTNSLVWTPLDIEPNSTIEKSFTVRVKEELPTSSDLTLTTKFNNEVAVNVDRGSTTPKPSPTPTPGATAPKAGISENLAYGLALIVTASAFYILRKRQLKSV